MQLPYSTPALWDLVTPTAPRQETFRSVLRPRQRGAVVERKPRVTCDDERVDENDDEENSKTDDEGGVMMKTVTLNDCMHTYNYIETAENRFILYVYIYI